MNNDLPRKDKTHPPKDEKIINSFQKRQFDCFDEPRFLLHSPPNRLQIFSYNRQGCNKFSLGVLSLGGPAAQIPSFVFSSVDEFSAIGRKKEEKEA